MPKNPKGDPLGSLNVFYKPTTSKTFKGVPCDRIQKISEKSRIVPKKPKEGPFGVISTFGNIKKRVERMNKKWTDRVELTKQIIEKTSRCKSRSFSSKTPTKKNNELNQRFAQFVFYLPFKDLSLILD